MKRRHFSALLPSWVLPPRPQRGSNKWWWKLQKQRGDKCCLQDAPQGKIYITFSIHFLFVSATLLILTYSFVMAWRFMFIEVSSEQKQNLPTCEPASEWSHGSHDVLKLVRRFSIGLEFNIQYLNIRLPCGHSSYPVKNLSKQHLSE